MVDETLDVNLQKKFKNKDEVLTSLKTKKFNKNKLIKHGKKKINKKFKNVNVDDEKKPRDELKEKIQINLQSDPTP